MYEVVEYYMGGDFEEVVYTAKTEEEARQWCEEHESYIGTDNYGEDGTYLRAPDGTEIWE